MSQAGAERQFGEGLLSRAAARVYSLMVVEFLLLVCALPGIVPLVLLGRDASNVPLATACALPLGPAFSAAVYALHHHRHDLTDLKPAAAFWRGYRTNLRPILLVWVPWLVFVTIVGVNLTHLKAAGVPGWWAVLLVILAIGSSLWLANALVIASLFAFRTRDVARLAAYFLLHRPAVTIGNACLLIVATGVTVLSSEAVLALLGSVFALAFLYGCRPLIAEVKREFTA